MVGKPTTVLKRKKKMGNEAAALSNTNPIAAAGIQTATGIANNIMAAGREAAQRKWVEKQTKEQREWDLDMWNRTNEYNDPKNQLARLENAGLNPLYYGLDGSSAGTMSAASPVGLPSISPRDIGNPIEAAMAAKLQNKQMELINSQIDKNKAETRNTGLDSDWKERTMNARVAAEDLKNNISEETIKEINAHKQEMEAHITKMAEETKSEIEKQGLLKAQKWLRNAEANQIAELLPYRKLLMEAQTDAQKAQAAASWANAAYNNGMIEAGYIDAITEQAKQAAKSNEQIAAINEFAASCKNGTLYSYNGNAFNDVPAFLMNGLVHAISTISQAVGGGLGGVLSALK